MNFNIIIKLLIVSDVLIISGFGLTSPIFAVFINQNISGGSIFTVGVASAIFLITKSLIEIPFSKSVDRYSDSKVLKWLLIGIIITSFAPLIYIFADSIYQIYFAQFIYGIGSGLSYPAWLGLWSSHMDENRKSFEWSVYNSLTGVGAAIAGAIGGGLAEYIGFRWTFLIVFLMTLSGSFFIICLRTNLLKGKPLSIMLDFPALRQTFDYDCGALATETVLAYYGIDVREDKIMKGAGTTTEGTPVQGIIKVLTDYGLKTKVTKLRTVEIKKYLQKNIPIIIMLQAWTDNSLVDWKNDWIDGHYVVVIGYDQKNIYFADPSSLSRTYLTYKELENRWHDVDADGKKYVKYGIVVFGKKPKYNLNNLIHMD